MKDETNHKFGKRSYLGEPCILGQVMSTSWFWEEEIVVSLRQMNAGAHSRNAPPQSEHRRSATTRGGQWYQCKRLMAVLVPSVMVR